MLNPRYSDRKTKEKVARIQISHWIYPEDITNAIIEILDVDVDQRRITKKKIEEMIKKQLQYRGLEWKASFESFENLEKNRKLRPLAEKIAKKLFPEFFGENAISFIRSKK